MVREASNKEDNNDKQSRGKQNTHGDIDESVSIFESNRKPWGNGKERVDRNNTNKTNHQRKGWMREVNNSNNKGGQISRESGGFDESVGKKPQNQRFEKEDEQYAPWKGNKQGVERQEINESEVEKQKRNRKTLESTIRTKSLTSKQRDLLKRLEKELNKKKGQKKGRGRRQPGFEPRIGAMGDRRDQRGVAFGGQEDRKPKGSNFYNIYKPTEPRLIGGTRTNRKVNPITNVQTPPRGGTTKAQLDDQRSTRRQIRENKIGARDTGVTQGKNLQQQLQEVEVIKQIF